MKSCNICFEGDHETQSVYSYIKDSKLLGASDARIFLGQWGSEILMLQDIRM